MAFTNYTITIWYTLEMERMRTPERLDSIDYLSEDITILVEFEPEAVEFLPKISDEDLKTRKEKFAVLMGSMKRMTGDTVKLTVKGIMEQTAHERFWKEGVEVVEHVDSGRNKAIVDEIRRSNTQYSDHEFLGDVHTHPIISNPETDYYTNMPSEGDIEAIIAEYERGTLHKKNPYIFMIAAPSENGETIYSIYRLVKTAKGYDVRNTD
jgi:hypothetical protein